MTLWQYARQKLSRFLDLRLDSDFFELLSYHFILYGVLLRTKRRWLRALYLPYQLLLPAQATIWLYRIWAEAYIEQNAPLAIYLLCGQFALLGVVMRCVLLQRSYGQLQPIQRYINAQRFLRDHPRAHTLRQRAFRTNNVLILALNLYGLHNFVVYQASGLQWHEIFRLPNHLTVSNRPLAWTLWIIMHPMTFNGLGAFIASFVTMHTLLTALHAELLLVEFAFEHLLPRIERKVRREAKGPVWQQQQQQQLLWQTFNRELAVCVGEHCEVLKQVREVNRVYRFYITVQYYTALFALAIDAFFISFYGLNFVTVCVTTFSILLVFEWYYCCKLVEDLQATNKRIGWTIYNDKWPGWLEYGKGRPALLRQFRTNLGIVLLATQRNLSFRSSDTVELSWQTFASMLKTSYSVMMFLIELRQLNR